MASVFNIQSTSVSNESVQLNAEAHPPSAQALARPKGRGARDAVHTLPLPGASP